jgi:hypothetical protein
MTIAETLRDEGISRVLSHNETWAERARSAINTLRNWEGTGEDLRLAVVAVAGKPKHHNAWGGVVMGAVKQGILTPTGEYRPMVTDKSHARKTPVYRA